MYNDDLTFELAFLETFIRKGYDLTAADVAEDWAAKLPFAFTAEGIALKNIKNGIYPPESGKFRNPFRELIGAQMRGRNLRHGGAGQSLYGGKAGVFLAEKTVDAVLKAGKEKDC
ncbi:MAG: hypothetical protein HFI44_14755 [Lachnospiraceae bacterium]|nr:hypothetical protein [Lachnospiraceae bacterium]